MYKNETAGGVAAILAILFAIPLLYVLIPMLAFFGGWVSGHIVLWILGPNLPTLLAALKLTSLTAETVPLLFGVLAVIGGFFSTNVTNQIKRN